MKRNQGKGKAISISGIPMPGGLVQVEGQSVEPNRDEDQGAFRRDDRGENYARDYFDDEEERLGDLDGPYIVNKDDHQWSDGLKDEENEEDLGDDEAILPETQPLHIDLALEAGLEYSLEVVLSPDNIDTAAA